MVHILLKSGLENFEDYLTSVWDECNCVVVWAFFGIAFLWGWNENWPFPVLWPLLQFSSVQFSHSVVFNSLRSMNCSMPGLPVHHQLPSSLRLMSIESVMPSSHLILCRPLLLLPPIPPSLRGTNFPMSQFFAWGGQRTGVSALAAFLPKNTQDWSPLEWTGCISLQSKGLSRVFSSTIL